MSFYMGVSLWDIPVLTTTTGNTKPAAVLAELTWIYAIPKKHICPIWSCNSPTVLHSLKGQPRPLRLRQDIRCKRLSFLKLACHRLSTTTYTKHGPGSMDHPMDLVHGPPRGPGPWTRSMDHPMDHP